MGLTRRRLLLLGGASLLGSCIAPGSGFDGAVPDAGELVLPFAQYPALAQPGGGVVLPGEQLVVIRTSATTAVALSSICTRDHCQLSYPQGSFLLECPCDGSKFDSQGGVVKGPATKPLAQRPATVGADEITVRL